VRQFIHYIFFGLVTVGIDIATLALLFDVLGISMLIAFPVAYTTAMVFNFFSNQWNFKPTASTRQQIASYGVQQVLNIGLKASGFYLLFEVVGMHYIVAKIIIASVAVIFTFCGLKFFVFRSQNVSISE